MKFFLPAILLGGVVALFWQMRKSDDPIAAKKPNIVIILADDQGYADVSYHEHPKEVSTPAIDGLAKDGMVFTNGYASAYVCAPTRAGLLTGRYQQRYGFYTASDSRQGLPLTETLLPQFLKKEGYTTGIFGKWHLGLDPAYRPTKRGFDEFYGFLGHGAHDYFDLTCDDEEDESNCIRRNGEIINDEGYLTGNLAREASAFIKKHAKSANPFFLYLPFNAVHWPLQAPDEDVARFNSGKKERDIMLGMLHRMDLAVGDVLKTLKETGEYENTMIFYFSDNGGSSKVFADNTPLRDYKQSTYEGGLRVPFIVAWPGKIKPGTSDEPVISLDILPTICATLKIPLPGDRIYDGRDLTPAIKGKQKKPLHQRLVWDGDEGSFAIREGDWKLVRDRQDNLGLYNLKDDIGDTNNLMDKHPDKVNSLMSSYTTWRGEMGAPMGRNKN